jgi:hypothetical protein
MKNLTIAMTVLGVLLAAIGPAHARDTKHILPIRRCHGNQRRERKA